MDVFDFLRCGTRAKCILTAKASVCIIVINSYKTTMYRISALIFTQRATGVVFKVSRSFSSKMTDFQSPRVSELNIQMLSESLHSQIFQGAAETGDPCIIDKCVEHLKENNLWGKSKSTVPDVNLKLPKLMGANIDEHFRTIAAQQSKAYFELAEEMAYNLLPPQPQEWAFISGWTKYRVTADGTEVTAVDYPEEEGLVFDVEVRLMVMVSITIIIPTS